MPTSKARESYTPHTVNMFFAQNIYGSAILSEIFHDISIHLNRKLAVTAKFLDVAPATLKRWIDGKANPPRSVVYALWHESHYGLCATSEHSHRGMLYERGHRKALEVQVSQLQAQVTRLNAELDGIKLESSAPQAMNEPFFRRA